MAPRPASSSAAARRSRSPIGVDTVVLDKTGTLTLGRPASSDVVTRTGIDVRTVLDLAAALERGSEHPLGAAIVARANERELGFRAGDRASRRSSVVASRARSSVEDGPHDVVVGNRRLARAPRHRRRAPCPTPSTPRARGSDGGRRRRGRAGGRSHRDHRPGQGRARRRPCAIWRMAASRSGS